MGEGNLLDQNGFWRKVVSQQSFWSFHKPSFKFPFGIIFFFINQGFWEISLNTIWKHFHAPKFCKASSNAILESYFSLNNIFLEEKTTLEIVLFLKQKPFFFLQDREATWNSFHMKTKSILKSVFEFWDNRKLLSICKEFWRSFENRFS